MAHVQISAEECAVFDRLCHTFDVNVPWHTVRHSSVIQRRNVNWLSYSYCILGEVFTIKQA
jgi:hypothetical protein